MKIVADENIVAVDDLFRRFGDLVKLPGRQICADDVRAADALLVRSITRVDRKLLAGSRVRFVATATSGTDHLDLEWLQDEGIDVVDAAGCNANAVMEYVFTALCELIRNHGYSLQGKTAAVIGCGHVGSRVLRMLQRLGIDCRVYDPLVEARLEGAQDGIAADLPARKVAHLPFCSFEEALNADIITLHTPLTRKGDHPTFHMLNADTLSALQPGALLINTGRGEVVDNKALHELLCKGASILTVFDVWEGEPLINGDLARMVDIATPHIAGYSVEAKQAASESNYRDFLRHFKLSGETSDCSPPQSRLPGNFDMGLISHADTSAEGRVLIDAICSEFPLMALSEKFKRSTAEPHCAMLFDQLRRELAERHEFGLPTVLTRCSDLFSM